MHHQQPDHLEAVDADGVVHGRVSVLNTRNTLALQGAGPAAAPGVGGQRSAHPVTGVDVGPAVDEVLGALHVSGPHGHVERRAAQLQGRQRPSVQEDRLYREETPATGRRPQLQGRRPPATVEETPATGEETPATGRRPPLQGSRPSLQV